MSEAAPVVYMCKYIYANICNYNRRLGNSRRLQKSSKIVAKSKILGTGGARTAASCADKSDDCRGPMSYNFFNPNHDARDSQIYLYLKACNRMFINYIKLLLVNSQNKCY
jgi:hypothetical protein